MSIHFINTTQEEFLRTRELYRFLPLEWALQSMDDRALWFANPLEWNDPFERRYLDAKYRIEDQDRQLPIRNRTVCLCLTRTYSCEAFWNVYAPNEIGIGFTINKLTLLEMLARLKGYRAYIGAAHYMNTNDITGYASRHKEKIRQIFQHPTAAESLTRQMELMLLKRVAFQYENEYRIVLLKNRESAAKGEKISFEALQLVTRLTLDPRIGPRTEAMLKSYLGERYAIPVVKSQIYGEPASRIIRL